MQHTFRQLKFTETSERLLRLTLLLLTVGLFSGCHSADADSTADVAPILVDVLNVTSQSIPVTKRFSGYSHPWKSHGIGFLVPGRIASIRVHEGQFVKKGHLLATLHPEDYRLVEQLARTQIDAIEPNYNRVLSLVEQKALPQSKLDEVQGMYRAVRTQKQQAKRQQDYTKLYAPLGGVVHEFRTSVGQVIGRGTAAVVLLTLDRVKVEFGVVQQDLKFFKVGDKLSLTVPGVVDQIEGTVFHIDFVADSTTRTYNVVVEVPNSDYLLRPSMLAHVNITTETLTGFFVPISAVMRDLSGDFMVKVVDPDTQIVRHQPIEVGRRYHEQFQITGGLTDNDQVIVRGNNYAGEGAKVVIR